MENVEAVQEETVKPVKRLCSEIQLFDLCDLEYCKHKVERFCENPELLARFEWIADEDHATSRISEPVDDEDEDENMDDDEDDALSYDDGENSDNNEEW